MIFDNSKGEISTESTSDESPTTSDQTDTDGLSEKFGERKKEYENFRVILFFSIVHDDRKDHHTKKQKTKKKGKKERKKEKENKQTANKFRLHILLRSCLIFIVPPPPVKRIIVPD